MVTEKRMNKWEKTHGENLESIRRVVGRGKKILYGGETHKKVVVGKGKKPQGVYRGRSRQDIIALNVIV